MKIVFMGTPDFAVGTLKALYDAGHDIAAVFTQPDKPQGRKMILTASPVKDLATSLGIPVHQPATLRDGTALGILSEISPELIVVVAYGKILPEEILALPKYGCMNVHGSLLPKYRGASPIQWSIVCGEKETGVTTMFMDKGMDTGDILETASCPINDEDNSLTLFDRLAVMGAELAVKTVEKIENGTAVPKKQDESLVSYAPMIKKEMGMLDFTLPAVRVVDLVRGLYGWPGAYFMLDGAKIKVHAAKTAEGRKAPAGTVLCSKEKLIIACGDGNAVELTEVQPEGKGRMSARDMLNGRPIKENSVIG